MTGPSDHPAAEARIRRCNSPLDIRHLITPCFLDRFWSKVDVVDDGCWEWNRSRQSTGYGQFYIVKGVPVGAHRVSFAIANGGYIPAGIYICHRCDNPPCVRPDDLFDGTPVGNAEDCIAKGRANRAVGEATPSARLTEDQVRAIRSLPRQYGLAARLAREYGVSDHTIRDILADRKWRHVS